MGQGMSSDTMSGLSAKEAQQRMEESKRKKLEEEGEDGDETTKPNAKKNKKNAEKNNDGDDNDIDCEDEVLYAQAVQDRELTEDQYENENELPRQPLESQKMPQAKVEAIVAQAQASKLSPRTRGPRPGSNPISKLPLAANLPPVSGATQSGETKPRPKAMGQPSGPSMSETSSRQDSPQTALASQHKTWGQCATILSFGLNEASCGCHFAVPTVLQTEAQKAKWTAEVVKQKPWLLVLEKALAGDAGTKISEQSFRSAISAAKKVTAKLDKKLEYVEIVDNQPLFSWRVAKFRTALDSVKELRSLIFASVKTTIDKAALVAAIQKVQEPFHELLDGKFIGFPEHWVQAQWSKIL